ncbi:MAG: tRNA pseudouridine(55) synthase TruB [Tissierellia bacterium]|nr:tRNA pseudouridine(55) synthase TruB [Tissierellia bacterium]
MHGILVVNKDKGYTSHDIVNLVRRATGIKKVGHTGTLDPMATGVLPICIGKATKVSSYVQGAEKVYFAGIKFGIETDTLDQEGKILKANGRIPQESEILDIIKYFTGTIEQIPPMYSAIKIKGKKLYELARENIVIERTPRTVEIKKIDVLKVVNDILYLRIHCSSGTYIRSLARDLGHALETYGCLIELQREKVGCFTIDQSITTEDLKTSTKDLIKSRLLPIDTGLDTLPSLFINEKECRDVQFGKRIYGIQEEIGFYRIYCNDLFVGLGTVESKDNCRQLHVKKVLMESL